jgi:hypothetical protein
MREPSHRTYTQTHARTHTHTHVSSLSPPPHHPKSLSLDVSPSPLPLPLFSPPSPATPPLHLLNLSLLHLTPHLPPFFSFSQDEREGMGEGEGGEEWREEMDGCTAPDAQARTKSNTHTHKHTHTQALNEAGRRIKHTRQHSRHCMN